jgi:predicted GH43/DUF377 family glycosyl hydrolase
MFRYKDRLYLSYRYHLKANNGRCATAICELDAKTFQPKGRSQQLMLSGPTGTEHHEDARLFMFDGEPHVSYTEMRGYRPGVDYTCVMKYARLRLKGGKWEVAKVFHPQYGRNDGRSKEKNWVFFETPDGLHAVYSGNPQHVVLRLKGERVEEVFETPGPVWNFGAVRGGTTPVRQSDGSFLTIFHSSVHTEAPPHFVRYYGAAYTFEGKPPFAPLRISTRPLMVGSEADGHRVDPRYVEGWKPYVVFPCGLVPDGNDWLVSLGINDWQCAVARVRGDGLYLGAANGTDIPPRYFRTTNGSLPVRMRDERGHPMFLHWCVPLGRVGRAGEGYMKCVNPREAQAVAEMPSVEEIDFQQYDRAQMGAAHAGR